MIIKNKEEDQNNDEIKTKEYTQKELEELEELENELMLMFRDVGDKYDKEINEIMGNNGGLFGNSISSIYKRLKEINSITNEEDNSSEIEYDYKQKEEDFHSSNVDTGDIEYDFGSNTDDDIYDPSDL